MKERKLLTVVVIMVALGLLTACSEPKSEPTVNGKTDNASATDLAAIKEDTEVMAEFAKNRMRAERLKKELRDNATQAPDWLGKKQDQLKGEWFPTEGGVSKPPSD